MAEPTFAEKINGIEYKYWNCPVKFIPDSIYGFLKIYDYYKTFPGAKISSYDNVSARFLKATQYYNVQYSEAMDEMIDGK